MKSLITRDQVLTFVRREVGRHYGLNALLQLLQARLNCLHLAQYQVVADLQDEEEHLQVLLEVDVRDAVVDQRASLVENR